MSNYEEELQKAIQQSHESEEEAKIFRSHLAARIAQTAPEEVKPPYISRQQQIYPGLERAFQQSHESEE